MNLTLNNLQGLICHKTQQTKPNQTNCASFMCVCVYALLLIPNLTKAKELSLPFYLPIAEVIRDKFTLIPRALAIK